MSTCEQPTGRNTVKVFKVKVGIKQRKQKKFKMEKKDKNERGSLEFDVFLTSNIMQMTQQTQTGGEHTDFPLEMVGATDLSPHGGNIEISRAFPFSSPFLMNR